MVLSESTIRQARTILPASACVLVVGLGLHWTATVIKQLRNSADAFSLSTEECSWLASIPEFFRALGTAIVFLLVDVVGRKKLYFSCPILFAISWSMLLMSRSVRIMFVARGIFGIGMGLNDALSLIYLAENSSSRMRGIFGSIHVSFFFVGVLLSYVIGAYLAYNTVALVNLVFQLFLMLCMVSMKEPAQYLIIKRRYDEAEKVFYWLRASQSTEVKPEFEEMLENGSGKSGKFSLRKIFASKANYKSLSIVIIITLLLNCIGIRTMGDFITVAVSESNIISPEQLTILFGLVSLISALVSTSYIENFNRKTILVAGLLGCGVAHFISALLYFWHENFSEIPHFSWMIFFSINLFSLFHCLTLSPLINVLNGELLSQDVRPVGSFLSITASSLASSFTAFIFLEIADILGMWCNFLYYSLISFLTIAYACWIVPEVRGKSLVEIQRLFENKK